MSAPLTLDLAEKLTKVTKDRADLEARERILVRRARSDGASWAAIGAALGVSKQAAAKRFAAVDAEAWAELRTELRQQQLPAATVAAVVEPVPVRHKMAPAGGSVIDPNVANAKVIDLPVVVRLCDGERWNAGPVEAVWSWENVTCPACLELRGTPAKADKPAGLDQLLDTLEAADRAVAGTGRGSRRGGRRNGTTRA